MARAESLEWDPDIDKWEAVLTLGTYQFPGHIELWKLLLELHLRQHNEFERKRSGYDLSVALLSVYNRAESAVRHDELMLANWKKEFNELRNSIDVGPLSLQFDQ